MQVQAEISVFSPTRHRHLSTGTLAPEIENRAFGAQADAPLQDLVAKPNVAQLAPASFPRTEIWSVRSLLLGGTQMMRCNDMRLMRSQITARRTANLIRGATTKSTQGPRLVSKIITRDMLWS